MGQAWYTMRAAEYYALSKKHGPVNRPRFTLNQRDELPLGFGVALDVALRHGQAGMPGELLHVPETAPDYRYLCFYLKTIASPRRATSKVRGGFWPLQRLLDRLFELGWASVRAAWTPISMAAITCFTA